MAPEEACTWNVFFGSWDREIFPFPACFFLWLQIGCFYPSQLSLFGRSGPDALASDPAEHEAVRLLPQGWRGRYFDPVSADLAIRFEESLLD